MLHYDEGDRNQEFSKEAKFQNKKQTPFVFLEIVAFHVHYYDKV